MAKRYKADDQVELPAEIAELLGSLDMKRFALGLAADMVKHHEAEDHDGEVCVYERIGALAEFANLLGCRAEFFDDSSLVETLQRMLREVEAEDSDEPVVQVGGSSPYQFAVLPDGNVTLH